MGSTNIHIFARRLHFAVVGRNKAPAKCHRCGDLHVRPNTVNEWFYNLNINRKFEVILLVRYQNESNNPYGLSYNLVTNERKGDIKWK